MLTFLGNTYVMTPLNEWPAHHRGRYLHNTQQTHQTNSPALSGIELVITAIKRLQTYALDKCFSTAGPRPGTGPWHQLYRAARGSAGIFHFSFLSNFSWINVLYWKYSEEKNIRECVEKLTPRSWPEETTICYKISLVQWLITNLN